MVFFKHFNIFFFLDVDLIPFNCVFDTNFHSKLLFMTISPLVFIAMIAAMCAAQCFRIRWGAQDEGHIRNEVRKVQSTSIYAVVLFLYSIFPLVSATILQTFAFDERLGDGNSYLVADYSIQRSDPSHQFYHVYGIVMVFVYCLGIPLLFLSLLHSRKKLIQEVQEAELTLARSSGTKRSIDSLLETMKENDDPLVAGLSPL